MSGINTSAIKLELRLMSAVTDFCDFVHFTHPKSGEFNSAGEMSKTIVNTSCICSSERTEPFFNEVTNLICSLSISALYGHFSSKRPNIPFIIENGTDDALVILICQASKASEYKNTVFYSTVYGDGNFIEFFILLPNEEYGNLKLKLTQPWVFFVYICSVVIVSELQHPSVEPFWAPVTYRAKS